MSDCVLELRWLITSKLGLFFSGIFFGDFVFSTRIVFRSDTGVVRVVPMVVVVTVVVLVVVLGISDQSKLGQGQPFGQFFLHGHSRTFKSKSRAQPPKQKKSAVEHELIQAV